jgi:hypothetical protein
VEQSCPNHDHRLSIASGLAVAASAAVVALLWLRHRRLHNPIAEANRLIESLNDKIGQLEHQVQSLRARS